MQKGMKSMEAHNVATKTKLREVEERNSKLEGFVVPKIRETVIRQKDISGELEKIQLDAQLLPSMFRAEAQFRKECVTERDEAVQKMKVAVKQHDIL